MENDKARGVDVFLHYSKFAPIKNIWNLKIGARTNFLVNQITTQRTIHT